MVPMRSGDGALLGIVSVDEPVDRPPPVPIELELLSTVVAHAAVAVEQAQTAELGRRHRAAVEHLLAVSAKLTERRTAEEVLDAVCWGTREALGFHKVVAFLAEEGKLVPLSGVGFTPERAAEFPLVPVAALEQLLDPAYMRHGCIVMERDMAVERAPDFDGVVLVGLQRARAARLGPPLGRRAAARLGRPARRDDVGRRSEGPAAAIRRGAPGAARVRQPGDGGDRVRAPAREPRAPRRARPAHRPAQPPRLRAGDRAPLRRRRP